MKVQTSRAGSDGRGGADLQHHHGVAGAKHGRELGLVANWLAVLLVHLKQVVPRVRGRALAVVPADQARAANRLFAVHGIRRHGVMPTELDAQRVGALHQRQLQGHPVLAGLAHGEGVHLGHGEAAGLAGNAAGRGSSGRAQGEQHQREAAQRGPEGVAAGGVFGAAVRLDLGLDVKVLARGAAGGVSLRNQETRPEQAQGAKQVQKQKTEHDRPRDRVQGQGQQALSRAGG